MVALLIVEIELFLASGLHLLHLLPTNYQLNCALIIKMAGTIFLKQKTNEFKECFG